MLVKNNIGDVLFIQINVDLIIETWTLRIIQLNSWIKVGIANN